MLLMALCLASAVRAAVPPRHVEARLVSELDAAVPGAVFPVALRLTMKDGWHTYWRNPGESGMATRVEWKLPPGFAEPALLWPYPRRFSAKRTVSFGYDDEVLLMADLRVPSGAPIGTEIQVDASARWLECKEICVPGKADLSLRVPVGPRTPRKTESASAFERARRRLPQRPSWNLHAEQAGEVIRLTIGPGAQTAGPVEFFPYDEKTVDGAKPQRAFPEGSLLVLELPRSELGGAGKAERLSGVLALEERGEAFELSVPVLDPNKRGKP